VKAGHVARMGKIINGHRNLVAKPEGTNHSKHQRVDGGIILKCILKNRMRYPELDSSASGSEPVPGSSEHGNESRSSIKCEELLLHLSPCQGGMLGPSFPEWQSCRAVEQLQFC
jgi:hypothetical protein